MRLNDLKCLRGRERERPKRALFTVGGVGAAAAVEKDLSENLLWCAKNELRGVQEKKGE